jgi:hypothetical protein
LFRDIVGGEYAELRVLCWTVIIFTLGLTEQPVEF